MKIKKIALVSCFLDEGDNIILDDSYMEKFVCNDIKLNPIIWELGHLAVSQNWLVLYLGHGTPEKIEWGKLFALGAIPPIKNEYPPYEEIWNTFKIVHEKSVKHVASLYDKEFTLVIVAAFLTIIGYSLNDTIVVFDRIRENLRRKGKNTLAQTINISIKKPAIGK